MPYSPRCSAPVKVFEWLLTYLEEKLPPRPELPPSGRTGRPPLTLAQRLEALWLVSVDGLSYRRAARVLAVGKTSVGESLDLLVGHLADLGFCQPDGTFIRTTEDLSAELDYLESYGEAVCLDGAGIRTQMPSSRANSRELYDAHHHQCGVQAVVLSNIYGDLLWVDGGVPGRAHELTVVECIGLAQVLADSRVIVVADRGYRGLDRRDGINSVTPIGQWKRRVSLDGATQDRNLAQQGVRSCVERAVAHLANAAAFRYWRGRIARIRDVIRVVGALMSLSRWIDRVPA